MSRRLVVEVGGNVLRAELRRGARLEWEVAIPTSGIDELEQRLRELRETEGGPALPPRLLMRLVPPLIQQRRLTDLPPVPGRELPGLLAHNTGRFFRQNGHALVTDGAWQGARGGVVVAVAVEDHVVERVLQAVTDAGFELVDIEPLESDGPRLSLLPVAERVRRRRAAWRRTGALAAVAAAAWVISLGAALVWLTLEDRALSRELARLEEPRRAVARVRQEIRDAEAEVSALANGGAARGMLAGRIADLVGTLPAGGLQRLVVVRDGTGELSGTTPSVVELLADLEQLAGLRPNLASPPTREAGEDGDLEGYLIRLSAVREP